MINNAIYKILKPLFLVFAFLSIFKGVFTALFKSRVFEYFDEAIFFMSIIILLPIFLFKRKLNRTFFFVGFFVFYSIAISLFFGISSNFLRITFQTLITIKFFIILLAFIELFKTDYKRLNNFFLFVIGFGVVGLVVHLLLGIKFNQWLGISTFARPNIRYVGFFTHPNHLAYLVVIYIAYLFNNKFIENLSLNYKDWLKIGLGFVIIILTDSRTAMLAVGILLFIFNWELIKKNYNLIFGVLLIGGLGLLYAYLYTNFIDSIMENISSTLDITSHYIRGNMIYLSGMIFIDYFPIGTGASTFGSVLSDNTVYALYDQADRYYFANEMGIYDSNIASIIGEYGFIGILLFVTMFIYIIKYLKSFTKSKTLTTPFLIIFLVYSITNPMFTNNLYTILSSLVLVLFVIKPVQIKTS
jgi:hypothetical protein